jgi:hypothetical protein
MPEETLMHHPRVFVSYSHDDAAHRKRILGVVERLRNDGFETMIDQYVEGTPQQGWPRWMLNQIDWADYVILVCTEIYYRRFRGMEEPGAGRGVDWEGAIITNELYDLKSISRRFVPVLFRPEDAEWIPEPLRSASKYILTNEAAYGDLTDFLAGAAGVEPAALGQPPARKRRTGAPLQFPAGDSAATSAMAPASVDLAGLAAPGGTMPADDRFYIARAADQSAKAAAGLPADTIVVKGPNQFGKSSLLAHYLARCRANGKTVAAVDFSRFEKGILSVYSRFLTTLAAHVARRLQVPPPRGELQTQQDFLDFLESEVLPAVDRPIVFAFDETDRVMPHDYAQDFFSMVRMWHNDRADPALLWRKVGLALASSSEPKLYIQDAMRSPFSVGRQIQLTSFSVDEVSALNTLYGSPLAAAGCARLHGLLGGHPFLTQDAYYKIVGPESLPFERLCADAGRDDGPFGAHLRAMFSNVNSVEGLVGALRQVLRNGTVPRGSDYYRLAGAGLVRRDEAGRVLLSNEIYAVFFRSAL